MYIVTNRAVVPGAQNDLDRLGPRPNPAGPNELRFAQATRQRDKWSVEILPDTLSAAQKEEVGITEAGAVYASRYVAIKILQKIRSDGRNLLFFVHGYNNNIKAVLDRAEGLADRYKVEVLPFSWPADGGGARGAIAYKSDKRDAKASIAAFDRVLALAFDLMARFTRTIVAEAQAQASAEFPDDHEEREALAAELIAKACPFSVNLMLHSMGNYLYKHLLLSGVSEGNQLLFDNVVLVAADTNNAGHAEWVDRIQVRRSVYITINENDSALQLSRMKPGAAQLARLGHFRHNLTARQAHYIDFTDAPGVGNDHAYFEGQPVRRSDSRVRRFFDDVFNGRPGEKPLRYAPATGMYHF